MHKPLIGLVAALLASPASSDTLISNVNGIQVGPDGELQHFGALLIDDNGRVESVIKHPHPRVKRYDRLIDGQGKTVLPGLIDAHGHVVESPGQGSGLGLLSVRLDLSGTSSIGDLQQRLKSYAEAHPQSPWILGFGWNQELWSDKKFPTVADIDAVVRDRPVWLERIDGHAAIANSAAMKAAGVTSSTQSLPGGRIENGLFVDNAIDLVGKAIPPPTPAELDQALDKAQDLLLSYGVTAVGSMSTPMTSWNALQRAGENGRLKVRFMVYGDGLDTLRTVPAPTPWLDGDHLRMVGIKFYSDGALGSRGAWLKQPYADKPDARGLQFHSDAELLDLASRAATAGFQLAIHAIGDAANAQVISTYEKLARYCGKDCRWRIEHAQIVDPADIPRIGRAGIIASMQPTHQTSDRLMAEKRLGPNRVTGAYAWHSILSSGGRLAFGSDFPFDRPNPFFGLSAAVSRQDVNGQPPGGWMPSERLSIIQALGAYTRGAAYASFAEDKVGSLEPGKWADFILVDRDPTKVDAQQLARTQVLETWIAGKKVWERASTSPAPERGK